MKHVTLTTVVALCGALTFGCAKSGVVVTHEADPSAQLASYRSYHLVVTPTDEADRTHWLVEKAIHDDMRSKGYIPVDRGSADLIVRYETDISGHEDDTVGHSLDGSIATGGDAEKHISVEMVDAQRNTRIWRGYAAGSVTPTRLTASVKEALNEIMAPVPPKS